MKENSIEEDIENINKGLYELADSYELYHASWAKRIFESIKEKLNHILSDYKKVLKENETLKKKIDLMENYMVENGWEICFDNIYAELNNCNGMERDWCRGDKLEKEDIHRYFNKKILESE